MPSKIPSFKKDTFSDLVRKLHTFQEENGFLASVLQDFQVEQQKYEGRILALQRAKQEAVSRVDQERSRAQDLQLQVEHLAAEKSKLQSHAKRRMEQMQRLGMQKEELEEAIIGIKEEADRHSEAATIAQREVTELRERLALQDAELQASLACRDSMQQDIRELKQQQARSGVEKQQLKDRVASLESALADATAAATEARMVAHGELGPSEREAAARDRAEMQVLQAELAGLLHKLQQQKTALCTAQHQVAHWKRKCERLEHQAVAQADAAAIEKDKERCVRIHAHQAIAWVQRLRTEVVEAAEAVEQLQAAKAALVHEKLVLAQALHRSTAALARLRGNTGLQTEGEDGAAQIGAPPWAEIAEAISQEQLHLERLELEMRRVLALERLRLADLREMQSLQERLSAETDVAWRLRERLAEQKLHGTEDCTERGGG
ncbi:g11215 [Coccomyxa elongata]